MFLFNIIYLFETGSRSVNLADLELTEILPLPPSAEVKGVRHHT